jgi:hypothetical protein
MLICWWAMVSAIEQPDLIGPEGVFEKSVLDKMNSEKGMTRDVAEMMVAAESLSANDPGTKNLNKALNILDELQRCSADLFDKMYDDFLDMYPCWRMYLLSNDEAQKNALLKEYKTLLRRFNKSQENLIQELGALVGMEKALLPSNVYVDPKNKVLPTTDVGEILKNL